MSLIIAFLILGVPILLLVLLIKARGRAARAEDESKKLRVRFASVLSIEDEANKASLERNSILQDLENLRKDYAEKRNVYDRLRSEVAIFDEKLAFAEMGVYEPHFDFGDSESFKEAISEIRTKQKEMVKAKTAVTCEAEWVLEGSKSKGRTMTNRQIRLTLRAFNNECDAAIANTRWNNVNAMEKRILNAATQIDKLNVSSKVIIEEDYLSLKLDELFLNHEYRETLKRERDERAEAARLARDEKRLIQEAEAAEKEEVKYRQMLAQAQNEVAGKTGQDVEQLQERIAELERKLEEVHALGERARSMAQRTRSGYVYIVSNIGSFGEDIVKIGLTRRLDPDDRVRELGDASVPFIFDTHAMIYSEDAPALESALHAEFHNRRVNAANLRKEFFRVGLDEVESAVKRLAPKASFFKDREAQDYHETIARRRVEAEKVSTELDSGLPLSI
ncbi:MAG: DUF4041 domain-containing protein [Candidatus Dadabacteria bacterium]|nr:DUF4041 domain-containing protein [Candidatus Dadabacteria bacterium]MYE61682.1 DUF4041 domain-containing protein [Candidatus Dadabacteria bacterium]